MRTFTVLLVAMVGLSGCGESGLPDGSTAEEGNAYAPAYQEDYQPPPLTPEERKARRKAKQKRLAAQLETEELDKGCYRFGDATRAFWNGSIGPISNYRREVNKAQGNFVFTDGQYWDLAQDVLDAIASHSSPELLRAQKKLQKACINR